MNTRDWVSNQSKWPGFPVSIVRYKTQRALKCTSGLGDGTKFRASVRIQRGKADHRKLSEIHEAVNSLSHDCIPSCYLFHVSSARIHVFGM